MDTRKRAKEIYEERLASKLAPELQERYKARREAAVKAQDANYQAPEAIEALGDAERLRALQTGLQAAANKFGSSGGDGGQASAFGKTADALNQVDRRQFEAKQKTYQDAVAAEDAAGRGLLNTAQAQDAGMLQAGQQARTELEQGKADEEHARKQGLLSPTDPRNVLRRNQLRTFAQRSGLNIAITDDMTAEQAEQAVRDATMADERRRSSAKDGRDAAAAQADLAFKQAQTAKTQAEADVVGQPKPKEPGIEERKRGDHVREATGAVEAMASALAKGNHTFSVVGDNDFTLNRRVFVNAIGRMESGGVIGKEEAEDFKRLAPTAGDSAAIQQRKFNLLRNMLAQRAQSLPTAAQPATPTQKLAAPKPGHAEDGYEFLGGDPSKPESWRRVK